MSDLTPDQLPEPWHPMTNARDLKTLGKLNEELGEAVAAASRCMIQGIEERNPETGETNREWLTKELADVQANIRMTVERFGLDTDAMEARAHRKYQFQTIWHGQL
jgi:hypothetical protein